VPAGRPARLWWGLANFTANREIVNTKAETQRYNTQRDKVRLKIATKRLLDDSDKEENGGGFHFKLSETVLVKSASTACPKENLPSFIVVPS